jgi:hypothetical protein
MDIPSWSYLAVGQRLLSVNLQMEPITASLEYLVPKIKDTNDNKPESTLYITLMDFIPESNGLFNWIVNHFT